MNARRPAEANRSPLGAASASVSSSSIAELDAVAVGLLEVVGEELLALDDAVAERALEPGGVALVQVGARLLGEARVGGVADEGVAEAERLLAREASAARGG